ncbi:MAG: LON peptidase substrate-binding domain-containing protein, partial [Myxococcota bacterium]|nr:LON peptidase substrate-binding domain-containing protein [Myxococcota bacterium]
NIVLLGLSRINILEEIPSEKMYRIAKAELISEGQEDGDFDLSSIQTLLAQVIVQNPKLSGSLEVLLQEDLSADKVLDILAHLLVQETYQRQKFMEKFSLKERASLIEGVLAELLMRGNSITE